MKTPKLKFYIYGYINKLKDEWFWIGKGSNHRYRFSHHPKKDNPLLYNKIKKLTPKNIDIVFISQFNDEDLAYEMEEHYINKIGCRFDNTGPLCNLNYGGRGNFSGQPGYWLNKKRPDVAGENHYLYGEHRSQEVKDKISKGHKDKKLSDETKKKMSEYRLENNIRPPVHCGEDNNLAKLTEKDVLEIRSKYIPRKYSTYKLAKEYSVSRPTIGYIVNRKTWTHI